MFHPARIARIARIVRMVRRPIRHEHRGALPAGLLGPGAFELLAPGFVALGALWSAFQHGGSIAGHLTPWRQWSWRPC